MKKRSLISSFIYTLMVGVLFLQASLWGVTARDVQFEASQNLIQLTNVISSGGIILNATDSLATPISIELTNNGLMGFTTQNLMVPAHGRTSRVWQIVPQASHLVNFSITLANATGLDFIPQLAISDYKLLYRANEQSDFKVLASGKQIDGVEIGFGSIMCVQGFYSIGFRLSGDISVDNSIISSSELSILADGQSTTTLTLQLKDRSNNNIHIGGDDVMFVTTNGTFGKTVDYNNGQYSSVLTSSTKRGVANISFSVNDSLSLHTIDVRFLAGSLSLDQSYLFAESSTIVADGKSTTTVTAFLNDEFGNQVEKNNFNIDLFSTKGAFSDIALNSDGRFTSVLKSDLVSGIAILSLFVDNEKIANDASVEFVAGTYYLPNTIITSAKANLIANGVDSAKITVQLFDVNKNRLKNGFKNVEIESDKGHVGKTTTNADGSYSATIRSSTKVERAIISVKVNGKVANVQFPIDFISGFTDFSNSELTVSPTKLLANGRSSSDIQLVLKDAFGNLVALQSSNITIFSTAGVLSSLKYAGNGVYKTKLTSTTVADSAEITYSVGTVLAPQKVIVQFVSGTPVANNSTIVADKDSVVADGLSTVQLTLNLSDMFGNRLAKGGDIITISPSLGTISSLTDNNDGSYSALLTSSKRSGICTVGFSINGSMQSTQTARVYMLPGEVDANQSKVSVSPTTLIADGVGRSKITISLYDTNNNALLNDDASVVAFASSGKISNVTKESNGTYSAIFTSDSVAQSAIVTFSVNGDLSSNSANILLMAGLPVANKSSISMATDTLEADGKTSVKATIILNDAFGNSVITGGDRVVVTSTIGEVVEVVDNGNGTYDALIISNGDVGKATITFTVNESTEAADRDYLIIIPRKINVVKSEIFTVENTIVADGMSQTLVAVQLKDDEGNSLHRTGEHVEIFTDKGTLSRVVDMGDGLYQATLTATTIAEKAHLYFSVNGQFNAFKIAEVLFVAGGVDVNVSTIKVSESNLQINSPLESVITVELKDKFGNDLSSGGKIVQIFASFGEISSVVDNGDGSYTATYRPTLQSGFATINFSVDGGNNSINSARIKVLSGAVLATNTAFYAQSSVIEADGVSESIITVQLKDSYGNKLLVGGENVLLTSTLGTISNVIDNNNGTYEASLTSSVFEEISAINCVVNGVLVSDTIYVEFMYGAPKPTHSTISASPISIVANGISTSTITVQTVDSLGVNLTQGGKSITLTATAGTLSAVTDKLDGTYTATLTSATSIGIAKVSFKEDGVDPIDGTVSVDFVAGKAAILNAHIVASDSLIIANGESTVLLSVYLYDLNGNLLSRGGDTILFYVSAGDIGEVVDNQNGIYTTLLTSPTYLDTATVTYSINGEMASETVSIAFVVGPAAVDYSTLNATKDTISADGISTSEIWIDLKDAHGININKGGDNVQIVASKGEIGSVTDHYNGTYSATLTSNLVSGNSEIRFRVNGGLLSVQKKLIYFAPGAPDVNASTITASPTSMIANGVNQSLITVMLRDKNGNLCHRGGEMVTLQSTAGNLSGVTDANNGTYSAMLSCTTVIDTANISFFINGNLAVSHEEIYFVAGLAVANNSQISASPTELTIDGVSTSYVEVALRDANGNKVSRSSDDVVVFANGSVINNLESHGDGTFGVSLPIPQHSGIINLTFQLNGSTVSDNKAKITIAPGGVDVDKCTIKATQTTLIADGISTSKLYVQLNDLFGNRVTSVGDHVQFLTTNGTFSDVVYEGAGVYSTVITSSTVSGEALIQFTVNGSDASVNSMVINFLSGTQVPDSAAIVCSPSIIVADGKSNATVIVQLRDINNNPYLFGGHSVLLKTDVGKLSTVVDLNNGSYTASLTSISTPDTATIRFSVNGSTISTSTGRVVFAAGPAVADSSVVEVAPLALVADGASKSTINIQLFDKFGNQILIGGASVVATSDFGVVSSIVDNNDGSYSATLTSSYVHQTATVTVLVDSVPMKQQFQIDFLPGNAAVSHSTILASPDTLVADGVTQSNLIVRLADRYGNWLLEGADTVVIAAQRGAVSNVVDGGDGSYSATYTSDTKSGDVECSFSVNGMLSTEVATVHLMAGSAVSQLSTISVASDTLIANGTDQTDIIVQLKDRFGNRLISGGDKVQISTNKGIISEVIDLNNGAYSVILTASEKAEVATITYLVNGVSSTSSANVNFVAGSANVAYSMLVASSDTIIANGEDYAELIIELFDAYGNKLLWGGDTVLLVTDKGTLSTIIDHKNGTYSAKIISSRLAETATISFYINHTLSPLTLRVEFIPGVVNADKSSISISPDAVVGDGISTADIVVLLNDEFGNQLIVDDNLVQVFTNYGELSAVINQGNGRYSSTIKSDYYGDAEIYFTVNGTVSAQRLNYTFLADDKDNDRLYDDYEDRIGTDPYDIDTDKDGVTDYAEVVDVTDPLQECSLILEHQTVEENMATWRLLDCDNDGVFNGFETVDADGDARPDYLDSDDDNDGLLTSDEMPDPNGDGNPVDAYDADRDGVPDYLDANNFSSSAEDGLEIYNAISPNGDGLNDQFTIRNIGKYPANRLTVLNRWGAIVYDEENFDTRHIYFEGKEKGSDTYLPVGVYFYILKYKNEAGLEKTRDGYLYLNY